MRELFAHPVHPLSCGALLLILIVILYSSLVYSLPQPIGNLSDYGNVLDRHGRDEINSLIASTKARYGIEVYILASWEDPFHNLDRYAVSILDFWGLARENTLLAVFMKTGRDWDVRVVAGRKTALSHPNLASYVQASIRDLVAHRRIKEAMEAIFPAIDRGLTGAAQRTGAHHKKVGRIVAVVLVFSLLASAAFLAHRRICPRCGHILRVQRTRGLHGEEDVVYYCPHCHYMRTKRERARGPRR